MKDLGGQSTITLRPIMIVTWEGRKMKICISIISLLVLKWKKVTASKTES